MRTFNGKLEIVTAGRGLHCVWAPATAGEAAPLVARWIDPNAGTNKSETREEATALADVEASRRVQIHLLAA